MKVSDDQNLITLDDGAELVAVSDVNFITKESPSACASCELLSLSHSCLHAPCCSEDRKDGREVIFVSEPI